MFTPHYTLIFHSGRVLARVDLSGRRQLCIEGVWSRIADHPLDLTTAATTALGLGPRRLGRVWVLSTEVWIGNLSLSSDIVALMRPAELDQALALEAEMDSGISAFTSRIGAQRLSDDVEANPRWRVTQVSTVELQSLTDALRSYGARVIGIAHPTAVQVSESPNATVNDSLDAMQEPADSSDAMQLWDEPADAEVGSSADARMVAGLTDWAEMWARCLEAATPLSPLMLQCEQPPLSTRQQVTIAATLALLAVGGCTLWYGRTQQRIVSAERAIGMLEEQQLAQRAAEQALKALEERVAQLRQEATQDRARRQALEQDLHTADATHAQQNQRWLVLLDALAECANDECWIQRLESNPLQTTLHGLATDNTAAHHFAGKLERSLVTSGWIVLPAQTKLADQDLVEFQIPLAGKLGLIKPHVHSQISSLIHPQSSSIQQALTHTSRGFHQ